MGIDVKDIQNHLQFGGLFGFITRILRAQMPSGQRALAEGHIILATGVPGCGWCMVWGKVLLLLFLEGFS